MKTPRKHAELIKAWADGAEIQVRLPSCEGWGDCQDPYWADHVEYRIKPEPKPDHVYYGVFDMVGSCSIESCFTKFKDHGDQIKLTFDGETGKLKAAEVLGIKNNTCKNNSWMTSQL
jgi:hypothetical protein